MIHAQETITAKNGKEITIEENIRYCGISGTWDWSIVFSDETVTLAGSKKSKEEAIELMEKTAANCKKSFLKKNKNANAIVREEVKC